MTTTDPIHKGRLAGQTAVVTAAAQGIGRAIAERFVAEGATVYASDLNVDGLANFQGGHRAALDATDPKAVNDYFAGFVRIDTLVHGVGFVHQGTITETSPEDWRKSMAITLDSAYYVLGAAVPKMLANGGSILTIASVASSVKGFPRRVAYGAAKGGIIGLTKAIAADYLNENLRANAISPGTVDSPSLRGRIAELEESLGSPEAALKFFTDRQPSGRFGKPEEIASLATFLASDEGCFINGQSINIDGGITI